MNFLKYPTIENAYRTKYIDKIINFGLAEGEWIVEEKIHGANFGIYFDGTEIRCAKRTGFLGQDDSFYNYKEVIDANRKAVENLFQLILSTNQSALSVIIYGELFGGGYPHDQVCSHEGAIPVQKEVWYSPENRFCAFDLMINDSFYDGSIEETKELFDRAGLDYARTLLQGSLEEALKYSNRFVTTLPTRFGLPPIEDNLCEGVVLKPLKTVFINHGRVVIKNKNSRFSEKTLVPVVLGQCNLKEKQLECYQEMVSMVTQNRLNGVVSKIGAVSTRDFSKLSGLMTKDVIVEFNKDNAKLFSSLSKKERKQVTQRLSRDISKLVRPYLSTIPK